MMIKKVKNILMIVLTFLCLPSTSFACAVCFGAKDSNLTKGIAFGIITLLAVLIFIFGLFIKFFISLNQRSKLVNS